MPLLAHFAELRSRVFRSALAFVVAGTFGWIFYGRIVNAVADLVCNVGLGEHKSTSHCATLTVEGVLGPLNLQIKVAILVGIIVSAPVWTYQLWAFVAPGLHKKERRSAVFFIATAVPFFVFGGYLGYRVLPIALKFLLGLTPDTLTSLVPFDTYLDFCLRIVLIFGLAFELPVFLVSLSLLGLIRGRSIIKPWRIAIFSITLFTAFFTPSGDPISMAVLAGPLILFYFGAGLIALLIDRRRDKKLAKEESDEDSSTR